MPEMQATGTSNASSVTPNSAAPADKAEPNPKAATSIPTSGSKEKSDAAATNQGEAAIKKFKLKIDGADHELPEPEMLAFASKGMAADKRFKEASDLRKDAETFLDLLKTDFTQLLDNPKLGLDEKQKRDLIEKYYRQKYIDPETLSPEQLRLSQAERELSQYKDREKQVELQRQQQQEAQLQQYHADLYQKEFIQALETQMIPKTPGTIKRMAELKAKQLQMGIELPPEQLASLVRQDIAAELKTIASAAKGDQLIQLLGEDVVNELRKADLARLRAAQPQAPRPIVETAMTGQPKSPQRAQSFDEMRAERDQKAAELQKSWQKKATV